MEPWWKTWNELKHAARDRKIILYGRSADWIPKTLLRLPEGPAYIIDRNPALKGSVYHDLPVYEPSKLDEEDRDKLYIVITAGPYEGIITYLVENGYEPGRDFCCTPEYRDFGLLEEIRNYQQSIIVSSSDYLDKAQARYSRAGGGLFRYHIGPNEVECLVPGHFRQVEQVGDKVYAIEYVEMALFVLDTKFNVLEKLPLNESAFCGLAHDPKRDTLLLVANDQIHVFDRQSFKRLDVFPYSDKLGDGGSGHHHVNDICVLGDYVYVSYFSHSGNWKKGIFDGGVTEFRYDAIGQNPRLIYKDLWMPHSPKVFDGNICVIDSMRGRLYTQTSTHAGEFDGFSRGLAYDGRFYYVGLSEDMYMSRVFGTRKNIMLNAGFFLFDTETKASRFYPMLNNMNIHDLLILKDTGA